MQTKKLTFAPLSPIALLAARCLRSMENVECTDAGFALQLSVDGIYGRYEAPTSSIFARPAEVLAPDEWALLDDGGDVFAPAGTPAPMREEPTARYSRADLDAQIRAIHLLVMSGEGIAEAIEMTEECVNA